MPTPATTSELIALIRRSGVIEETPLDGYLAQVRSDLLSPTELLEKLVVDGLLTPFQSGLLAQGRWKGFTVGDYRLLDRIGTGGMSHVYLAEHSTTKNRVAIKVLAARLVDDQVAKERFLREAKAATSLTHPNIVHVLDVDVQSTNPYMVMEYIDGVSLQASVARHGTFTAGTAAYCGRQVALGLQRAHEVGLVHRDVKPANVLITRKGLVKILDLGIVRVATDEDGSLTRRMGEKFILGTAEYMAPEQCVDSSTVDSRADIYALGGTLYFLLAGHPPFPNGTQAEKMTYKLNHEPSPILNLRPDVPRGLATIIHRMLAREAKDRFSTPLDVAIALSKYAMPDSTFPNRLFTVSRTTIVDEGGSPTDILKAVSDSGPSSSETPPTDALKLPTGTVPEIDLGPATSSTSNVVLPATKPGVSPEPLLSKTESFPPIIQRSRQKARAGSRLWMWLILAGTVLAAVVIAIVSFTLSEPAPASRAVFQPGNSGMINTQKLSRPATSAATAPPPVSRDRH